MLRVIPPALRRLLGEIVATSPRKVAILAVLVTVLTLTEGANLLLLMPLLQLVGINEPTTMPNVAAWFEGAFDLVGLAPTLGTVLMVFVGLAGIRAVLFRFHTSVEASLEEEFVSAFRIRVYKAVAGTEWRYFVTKSPSTFVHVLTGEIDRAASAGFQLIDLIFASVVSLVYLGMAFHFSPVMAIVVLACGAAMSWGGQGQVAMARSLSRHAANARSALHAAITEHVASMKTARSYGVIEQHTDIFVRLSKRLRDVSVHASAVETDLKRSQDFGATVMLAVIVFVSYELLNIASAQVLILLFVFARLLPRLAGLQKQVLKIAKAIPVLEHVTELERECLEVAEGAPKTSGEVSLEHNLRLERVSFTYLGRNDPALRRLDLVIPAGSTTAIVGPSGSGKSTLADILIGLLMPTDGRVLVDGVPLDAERLEAWRRQVSYVPQETVLFHGSVRANLTWARADATDAELWQALQMAASEKFVRALPQGLDTIIGERGVLVSGGERQRLSLARALVRRPRVLVLDEATSSLDSENERHIQEAIAALHKRMTIVVITHRLSTIRDADLIHVLQDGRLVESGNWEALLAHPAGRFRDLCQAQGLDVRGAMAAAAAGEDPGASSWR